MFRTTDTANITGPDHDGDGEGERLFDALGSAAQGGPLSTPEVRQGFDGLGDRIYDYWKGIGLNMVKSMPVEYQDAMLQSLGSPRAASILQGRSTQYFMQGIGAMLPGHGVLYEPHYNHKMLAEDAQGNVRALTDGQIYTLFPPATEDDPDAESRWPRLLLTASHARAGSLKDMTSITHGVESLMKECFKANDHEKHFEPMQFEMGDFWNPQAQPRDPQHKKLMIAFACDVDRNPFLNGAALLRRVEELVEHGKKSLRKLASGDPIGAVQDDYEYASQGSYRLAKAILQCLVTEPERIDTNFEGFLLDQPGFGATPLMLRPDFERVASSIGEVVYSKAGEVGSTALRMLRDELMQKREDGTSLVYMPDNGHLHGGLVHYAPIHDFATKDNPYFGAQMVLRHIPVLSLAAIEAPLTKDMQLSGIRRVSINNRKDFISGHTQLRETNGNDEVIWVDGVRDFLGHAPADALGTRETKGYILKNEAARRRIEEYSCALYGAAAISNLQFYYDAAFEAENRVAIIPAAGTSDKDLLAQCDTITRYLEQEGFTGVHVGPTEWNPSELLIAVNEPLFVSARMKEQPETLDAAIENVAKNIEKLGEAFRHIRDNEPGLVINQRVNEDIDSHYRREVDNAAQSLPTGETTKHRDAQRQRRQAVPADPAWLYAMDGVSSPSSQR